MKALTMQRKLNASRLSQVANTICQNGQQGPSVEPEKQTEYEFPQHMEMVMPQRKRGKRPQPVFQTQKA
jgi:hypothetical protein